MTDSPLWMPFYVADYISDTRHLSTLEHGGYMLLLMSAWSRDGLLPSDTERLRRLTGMAPKEWKSAWPVLKEFFTETTDGFRHSRIDRELERGKAAIDQKRQAGKRSAEARKASKESNGRSTGVATERATDGQREGNQPQPQPQPQEEAITDRPVLERENTSLHPILVFAGRVVRLNAKDFSAWETRYSAIPDFRAELGALDDWLRDQPEDTRKKWFHVASAALAKKHQKALAERQREQADDCRFTGPC